MGEYKELKIIKTEKSGKPRTTTLETSSEPRGLLHSSQPNKTFTKSEALNIIDKEIDQQRKLANGTYGKNHAIYQKHHYTLKRLTDLKTKFEQ